jgi:hypothetical protein
MSKQIENWYFTFGCNTPLGRNYTKIKGTHESARKEMFSVFGEKWAFQYDEKSWYKDGLSQAELYNYKELKLKDYKK